MPATPLWIVTTCETWNCAVNAIIETNGELTFAIPVGSTEKRWVVLRRVVGGSHIDTGHDPHQVEAFDGVHAAITRMSVLGTEQRPMIMSAPDGNILVVSLRPPGTRRRAVGH